MATYKSRFAWLVDNTTNGDRGIAFSNDFGGPGLSYWPTEYGGRPVVGFEGKTFRTPEAAVDAALSQTLAMRAAAEAKNAKARGDWEKKKRGGI